VRCPARASLGLGCEDHGPPMGRARVLFLTLVLLAVGTLAGVISFFHTDWQPLPTRSRRGRKSRTSLLWPGVVRPQRSLPYMELAPRPAQLLPPPLRQPRRPHGRDETRSSSPEPWLLMHRHRRRQDSRKKSRLPLHDTRLAAARAAVGNLFAGHEGLFSIYIHASQREPGKLPPVFQGRVIPSKVSPGPGYLGVSLVLDNEGRFRRTECSGKILPHVQDAGMSTALFLVLF